MFVHGSKFTTTHVDVSCTETPEMAIKLEVLHEFKPFLDQTAGPSKHHVSTYTFLRL